MRCIKFLFACTLLCGTFALGFSQENKPTGETQTLFIGTYSGPKSEGIYSMQFNPVSGKLSNLSLAAKSENPSFLALDTLGSRIFCVNEISAFKGKKAGAVSSFSLKDNNKLELISQESSVGDGPCHLALSKNKTNLVAVNYGGGSTCLLPVDEKGKLAPASDFIQHEGTFNGKKLTPHAHSVQMSPDGKFAVIADLGLDKIFIHEIDAKSGKFIPFKVPFLQTAKGAGPRHMAFHPEGKHLFVVNESNSTVTVFRWQPEKSDFKTLLSVSTLPTNFQGNNSTAEIVVHPNGKNVYASNRGHNSICVLNFNADKETLEASGHAKEKISTPRNFTIHPSGNWLLVGNQATNSISIFKVELNGGLTFSELVESIPTPVCLRFWIR